MFILPNKMNISTMKKNILIVYRWRLNTLNKTHQCQNLITYKWITRIYTVKFMALSKIKNIYYEEKNLHRCADQRLVVSY